MRVIYGSRIVPWAGLNKPIKDGVLMINQNLFPEFDCWVGPEDIRCRLLGSEETLKRVKEKLSFLESDKDALVPCLLFQGDTGYLLGFLKARFKNLEILNCDDDNVFAELEKEV
jgi:hypothetical protein